MTNERNCENCAHARPFGGPNDNRCSAWECEYIDRQEAIKAYKERRDIVRCGECIHFHYDKPYIIQGIPVLGHEVCDFWGDGCKTNPNGFCSHGERREDL